MIELLSITLWLLLEFQCQCQVIIISNNNNNNNNNIIIIISNNNNNIIIIIIIIIELHVHTIMFSLV